MLKYILKNLFKRKRKYILSMLVISSVVLLFIVMNSLSIAYKKASELPFKNIQNSIVIQKSGNVPEETKGAVLPCSMTAIKSDYLKIIASISGVKNISSGLFLWVFDKDYFKRVMGVDWESSLGKKIISGIIAGSSPKSIHEVLVEQTFSSRNNFAVGDKIDIAGNNYSITGIVQMTGKNIVESDYYADLRKIQETAYNSIDVQKTEKFEPDDVNIIFVDADLMQINNAAESLNKILAASDKHGFTPTGKALGTFTITTPKSFESQISSFFFLSDKLMLLILITIIAGAILIIISSLNHNVIERTKEFGIMRAVGYTNINIQKIIISETFILLITGYLTGIIASLAVIYFLSKMNVTITIPWELNPFPHFLLSSPSQADTIQSYLLPIKFQLQYAITGFFISLAMGILTIAFTLRTINKFKVMEVLRHE